MNRAESREPRVILLERAGDQTRNVGKYRPKYVTSRNMSVIVNLLDMDMLVESLARTKIGVTQSMSTTLTITDNIYERENLMIILISYS